MPSLGDILAGKAKHPVRNKVNRNRKIVSRRYDIVGHKTDGTITRFSNVSNRHANALTGTLRKEGNYRIDRLEVSSSFLASDFTKHEIVFTEKNYVAPDNAVVARQGNPTDIQTTFPWDVLSDTPAAWLNPEPKHISEGHRKVHAQAIAKASRKDTSIETRSDTGKVMVFEKMSGELVFYGTEPEALFFLSNGMKKPFANYVFYVGSKTYAKAVR